MNNDETDLDCGGGACAPCTDLEGCALPSDCSDESCLVARCQRMWINEIHYDNAGTDVDESVEVAGTAGADLTGWKIVLYNGTDGQPYGVVDLAGVIPDQQAGKGTLTFPAPGMQNGSPDGLALVLPGPPPGFALQLLSYEGAFIAGSIGMSNDIGVSETGLEGVGNSLQLTGTGSKGDDFTWTAPSTASPGGVNTGQTFN